MFKHSSYDELSSDDRDMYDELLLTAENEGAFYPDDHKGAVQRAFEVYVAYKNENMRESFRTFRWALADELKAKWDESRCTSR